MAVTELQRAHIENWRVEKTSSGKERLVGIVSDHPDPFANSWRPWDISTTSPLSEIDEANGIAITRNTIYTLGKKAPGAGN